MPTPSLRPYFILLAGQVCSWFGSELVQFALVWWLTKTTGQAAVLTLATTIAVLPSIFIGPFAGALVDRWNRRLVMMVADGVIAGATLLLALLFAIDRMQLWHVYAVLFVRALGGVFALQLAIVTGLSPLGLYVAGQVADHFGAAIWFVLAGIGYALSGMVGPLLPALMQIEEKGAPTA